ncbi:MAG: hypothetical protein A3F41_02715 [Coxiella sp. RIFCSPHIGHO2_12_FULL_44_14]|nr:MAG: hypothetical protein A3F41_02715 [Coxiella sp. RIFCSPHIGHO2_12_FULL_44_14]
MYYVQESLGRDEKLIYVTRSHWIVFFPAVCTLVMAILIWNYLPLHYFGDGQPLWHGFDFRELAVGVVCIFGIVILLRALIFYFTTEYAITTMRVAMKTGWLQRQMVEVFLNRIEALNINQTIMGRVLNYGTVVVIGVGGTSEYYPNVPRPVHFHRMIQHQLASLPSLKK